MTNRRIILTILILLALLVSTITTVAPIPRAAAQSGPGVSGLASIVIDTTLVPKYSVLSFNVVASVSANVTLESLSVSNDSSQVQFLSTFKPQQITALGYFGNGTIVTLQYNLISGSFGSLIAFYVKLHSGMTSATILFQGAQSGTSFLGRYVTQLPEVSIGSAGLSLTSYSTELIVPQNSIISQAYAASTASQVGPAQPIPPSTTKGAPPGDVLYEIPPIVSVVVLQSTLFVPLSIALILLAALLLVFTGLGFFAKGRQLIEQLFNKAIMMFRTVTSRLSKIITSRPLKIIPLSSLSRKRFHWRDRFKAKNLLVLFILCGVLMVSFATLTGPNPNLEVYVIANPAEVPQIQSGLQAAFGNVQIVTPSQDYGDFNVMSSVGAFNMVIVSSYPSLALPEVSAFVSPNLGNVPVIVVDNLSDPSFAAQLRQSYPNAIVNVGNATNLSPSELSLIQSQVSEYRTSNTLGLRISSSNFKNVLVLEAGLSFLLVLLGWAYLGAKVTEPANETSLVTVGSVIASGIFVFYFSEVLYVVTSATLHFPLSLHAVISGADTITAVGLFGKVVHLPLGGGTTPRLLVGVLGLLFGGFVASKNRMFNKGSLGLIVGTVVLLVANPFALGRLVFQGLLLFVGNTPLGTAYASALTVKGFFYGIGSALGGTVTPVYLMSAGKMVYFAGLVPLAFIKKMGRVSATITFLVCAVLVGDGGVRVGEMTPTKTVIAVLPGLIGGVAIALIFLLIAVLERYLTTMYVKSRP